MHPTPLPRLDVNAEPVRRRILPCCRLKPGDIYRDERCGHAIGCGDATDSEFIRQLVGDRKVRLALQDPPYNVVMYPRRSVEDYISWCRQWVNVSWNILDSDAALYVWMGADQEHHFQPLPQFMAMMTGTEFRSRSLITVRNQRGYGTQRNWMAVRQELLYYTKGSPAFNVQYTEIPKVLRGYYKQVNGMIMENLERSRSKTIRPGNVWLDIQQVFYRLVENVPGCYAQKPLSAIERIIRASSRDGELVADFFSHSGTTLLGCERTGRRCVTCDNDPVFVEITLRRLERYRACGKTGWQTGSPFEEGVTEPNTSLSRRSQAARSAPAGAAT